MSADFNHPLSYERPFKFLHHLIGPLAIDNILTMSAINNHSAHISIETARKWIWKRKRTWKWKRKRKLTIHRHGHGHRCGHGHVIWKLLLSCSYGAIVPIAPYGMPLKYHGAISNGAKYL